MKSHWPRAAFIAVVAQAAAAGAFAADMPVKAPVAMPAYSWTGWYAGLNAGFAESHAGFSLDPTGAWAGAAPQAADVVKATTDTLHPRGFAGGGQIGWNYQLRYIVIGLEADIDYVGANSSLTGGAILPTSIVGFSQAASEQWLSTVRGRLGFLVMPEALVYATGGLAMAGWNLNMHMTSSGVDAVFSDSLTRTGWTVGGGLEVALARSWTGKVEYFRADFGSVTGSSVFPPPNTPNFTQTHNVSLTTDTVRVGLNYQFH